MKLNMEIGLAGEVIYVILISEHEVTGQINVMKELYMMVHSVKKGLRMREQ